VGTTHSLGFSPRSPGCSPETPPTPSLHQGLTRGSHHKLHGEFTLSMSLVSYTKMALYAPLSTLSDDGSIPPLLPNDTWKKRFFVLLTVFLITIASIFTSMIAMVRSASQHSCVYPLSLVKAPYSKSTTPLISKVLLSYLTKDSPRTCQISQQILNRRSGHAQVHGPATSRDGRSMARSALCHGDSIFRSRAPTGWKCHFSST